MGGFVFVGANLNVKKSYFFSSAVNQIDPMAAMGMLLFPERSAEYMHMEDDTFKSSSSWALGVINSFVDMRGKSPAYGSIGDITINNCNLSTGLGSALYMAEDRNENSVEFQNLLINNSEIGSLNGRAIFLDNSGTPLTLNNFVLKDTTLQSVNFPAIEIKPSDSLTNNNIRIKNNSIISNYVIPLEIGFSNQVNIYNNFLDGQSVANKVAIKGFNELDFSNNLFKNWNDINTNECLNAMLNDPNNINPLNSSASINISSNELLTN